MRIGVVFPQTEIGTDPGAIRAFAEAARDFGYAHILAYDHVLGADPTNRPGWDDYSLADQFHEPLVLFGFLAAVAPGVELVTDIVILPQRQTALVAKQAAEVDLLSGGRLRLGVGVGWSAVEFAALNADFRTRGRRIEEQIALLRALWTEPVATFAGDDHRVTEAGLNPLPVQRPIPVWIGGDADVVVERAARLADGWMPLVELDAGVAERIALLRDHVRAAGRSPDAVGVEGRLKLAEVPEDRWGAVAERWRAAGATHLGFITLDAGLATPDAHIDAMRRFADVMGLGRRT